MAPRSRPEPDPASAQEKTSAQRGSTRDDPAGPHWALIGAAWLSLLLSLISLGGFTSDSPIVLLQGPKPTRYCVTAGPWALKLMHVSLRPGPATGLDWEPLYHRRNEPTANGTGPWLVFRTFYLPWGVIAAAFLVPPLLHIVRRRGSRLAKRARPGLCAACGYDLRGSSGDCPECGAARCSHR